MVSSTTTKSGEEAVQTGLKYDKAWQRATLLVSVLFLGNTVFIAMTWQRIGAAEDLLQRAKEHSDNYTSSKEQKLYETLQNNNGALQHNLRERKKELSDIAKNVTTVVDADDSEKKLSALSKEIQIIGDIHAINDCTDIRQRFLQANSGVYVLYQSGSHTMKNVTCDMSSPYEARTVIQYRNFFPDDHQVPFNQPWDKYAEGFGEADGEYWIGNAFLHKMTSVKDYRLQIILYDWFNQSTFGVYDTFYVGSVKDKFNLTVDNFHGNAGDSLAHSNNSVFSTIDSDIQSNCSRRYGGAGWWFAEGCTPWSNLNGIHLPEKELDNRGIWWQDSKAENAISNYKFVKSCAMMVSPK